MYLFETCVFAVCTCLCFFAQKHVPTAICTCTQYLCVMHTGWRRPIGCLKLQVNFRKRATKNRVLLREMTYKFATLYRVSQCMFHTICMGIPVHVSAPKVDSISVPSNFTQLLSRHLVYVSHELGRHTSKCF